MEERNLRDVITEKITKLTEAKNVLEMENQKLKGGQYNYFEETLESDRMLKIKSTLYSSSVVKHQAKKDTVTSNEMKIGKINQEIKNAEKEFSNHLLKTFVDELQGLVNNPKWDNKGEGLIGKKVPKSIELYRERCGNDRLTIEEKVEKIKEVLNRDSQNVIVTKLNTWARTWLSTFDENKKDILKFVPPELTKQLKELSEEFDRGPKNIVEAHSKLPSPGSKDNL
jgi:hypothetical protein